MEPRFLLDTNICIYIRKNRPEQVRERFLRLKSGEAALSVITYGELLHGAAKCSEPQVALERLAKLMTNIPVLELPESAAREYGKIRADLERKGEIIGANDLWIAAHAKAAKLILITNNEREFKRVEGLRLQNWVT